MNEIIVREAVPNDWLLIYELNRDGMGYEYPPKMTKEKLLRVIESSHDKVYIAEIGGRGAGYIHVNDYDVLYAPHMKNIMGISVSDKFRRMGIGTLLISKAEEWARQTGADGIRLVSGEARTGAHEFYRSCGYVGGKKQLNFKKSFSPL